MNLGAKFALASAIFVTCGSCLGQEWVKPNAGRQEYVEDRTECAHQGQLMSLVGDALDRDIRECLVSKGWQRNLVDNSMPIHCEDKPLAKSCKAGGTEEMYKKDRADCYDQTMKTVGNKYSKPGWFGLGGLIVSSIQAEDNKNNLEKAQLVSMKYCLEGKNWTVELKEKPSSTAQQRPEYSR